jgi:hypothetical protein
MDCAVDGGEGQPTPELGPGGSCGVHSWIEGASGDGRRVSWFAPQNQGGGRRLKTPSRGGTGVGLGTDGGDGRRRRLGPRCGRGGDGRRAASRAVRRPRRERRLGPRRGGGNLPAREVLAVFSKPATYPGYWTLQNRGLDLHQDGGIAEKTSFRRKNLGRRMRSLYRGCCRPTGLTGPWHRSDRSNQPV